MRISDWSSDVCSSDLRLRLLVESNKDLLVDGLDKGVGQAMVPETRLLVDANVRPVYQRNYPMSIDERRTLAEEVEKMLKQGVIEVAKIGRAACRERVCQYVYN